MRRHYSVYWLQKEVAYDYFGREEKLYQLFLDYHGTSPSLKDVLKMQVDYITRPIPTLQVQRLISKMLGNHTSFISSKNKFIIELQESYASLSIKSEYICIESEGNYDAETLFFEVLRKFDECFLAMDFTFKRFGWLNPIKQRKLV